jgi:hypothetical protein
MYDECVQRSPPLKLTSSGDTSIIALFFEYLRVPCPVCVCRVSLIVFMYSTTSQKWLDVSNLEKSYGDTFSEFLGFFLLREKQDGSQACSCCERSGKGRFKY